jgi:hypothetical protein
MIRNPLGMGRFSPVIPLYLSSGDRDHPGLQRIEGKAVKISPVKSGLKEATE